MIYKKQKHNGLLKQNGKFFLHALVLCCLLFSVYLYASETIAVVEIKKETAEQGIKVSRIISVYDGDTFRVDIEGWPDIVGKNIGVRVRGIDTPEVKGKCEQESQAALVARDYVRQWLSDANKVTLRNIDRDKYFRLLADVYIGETNLAQQLIASGYAVPYDGGKKSDFCNPAR